jgi:hypothetical protein
MSPKLLVAEFLPDIQLPSSPDGIPVPLRPAAGHTIVLFGMHSAACQGCRQYLDELSSSSAEFEAWDARLTIVVPGLRAVQQFAPGFGTVLVDPDCRLSSPQNAAIIIADRYGQVFEACHAGAGHRFPAPRQIEEWLKFLGTLCPE